MLNVSNVAVEIMQVTVRGVGRSDKAVKIDATATLKVDIEDTTVFPHSQKTIQAALEDSLNYSAETTGDARKDAVSIRIGRDFQNSTYRFVAPGTIPILDERGKKVDRILEVAATVKGALETRIVAGVLRVIGKIEMSLTVEELAKLASMVKLETVLLTVSTAQTSLNFSKPAEEDTSMYEESEALELPN